MNRTLASAVLAAALTAGLTSCSSTPPPPPQTADAGQVSDLQFAPRPTGLDIPAIDVHSTEFVDLELSDTGVMEVPQGATPIGWYALGPRPGEVGPSVLASHVNYDGVPGGFARLHELKIGDKVTVTRADGSKVDFEVYKNEQFPKSEFPHDRLYSNRPNPELVMVTCGGELNEAAHSYEDNIVVSARMVA